MGALATGTIEQLGSLDSEFSIDDAFPPSVTITRTSEEDFQSRQVIVSIDGKHVSTLLWGDSVTCDLPPGPHRVRVHNTLVWKSMDFVLGPGEQVFFEVINRMGPGTLLFTILLGIGPLYLTLRRM
jgi:hypothetical protein